MNTAIKKTMIAIIACCLVASTCFLVANYIIRLEKEKKTKIYASFLIMHIFKNSSPKIKKDGIVFNYYNGRIGAHPMADDPKLFNSLYKVFSGGSEMFDGSAEFYPLSNGDEDISIIDSNGDLLVNFDFNFVDISSKLVRVRFFLQPPSEHSESPYFTTYLSPEGIKELLPNLRAVVKNNFGEQRFVGSRVGSGLRLTPQPPPSAAEK